MENLWDPQIPETEMKQYSALALAHIGDGVYELLARTHLAVRKKLTAKDLHMETVRLVCAKAQAEAYEKIRDLLTEDEQAVYTHGRNAKPKTVPAHAERSDYSKATGIEALFGWLFLSGQNKRANELFSVIISDEK